MIKINTVLLIITKAPYGFEDCFSGLYVAIACLNSGLKCIILFIGDGVYATISNQNPEKISMPSVADLIYTLLSESELYVHKKSLQERKIPETRIIKGIKPIEEDELVKIILKQGEAIITF
ncbi:MAG: DsrE family protein [Candidatus Jordarchaeum sp.]|uniref:DsrE family protein n=1 Tax=Candidatus Jordarchaeum sp. TaxID=2823881 RepID=UPI004049CFDE